MIKLGGGRALSFRSSSLSSFLGRPNLISSIPSAFHHCYKTSTTIPPSFHIIQAKERDLNLQLLSVSKMNNGGVESSNEGSQSGGSTRATAEGGTQSGKAAAAAVASYSGVVAQRVLYGSYKRRVGGRRMASKSAPSRLSKVSAADSNNT